MGRLVLGSMWILVLLVLVSLTPGTRAASDGEISFDTVMKTVSEATYIDPTSRARLNQELRTIHDAEVASRKKPGLIGSVFSRAFSKLTILNVLYFIGALIVIGAMTLFITIGFEAWGGTGLFVISALYFVGFFWTARIFWADPDYRLVGGLLATCSLAFVPLGTYGLQKAAGRGPGRSYQDFHRMIDQDWLVMEIATLVVGAFLIWVIPFPFLTMPIAFVLVYMGMDTVPLLFMKRHFSYIERAYVGIFFGVDMMVLGYLLNKYLPDVDDFGFWLFLFGTPLFWISLSTMPPSSEAKRFVYSLINVTLLCLGHVLDRFILTIFGCIGVTAPAVMILSNKVTVWKLGRLLASVLVLALAQPSSHGFDLEYLAAVMGIVAYAATLPLDASSSEIYYWQLLSANLGFIVLAPLFTTSISILNIVFIPRAWLLNAAASFGVLVFIGSPYVDINAELSNVYQIYRGLLGVGLMLLSVPLHFPPLLWLGAIGVHSYHIFKVMKSDVWRQRAPPTRAIVRGFAISLTILVSSVFFESLVLFYLSLMSVIPYYVWSFSKSLRNVAFPLASVFLLIAAVLTQSQLITSVVGIGLFSYFSYLAFEVFKNSLLFPLALSALGGALIYIAVKVQQYGPIVYAAAEKALPDLSMYYTKLEQLSASSWPIYWTVPVFAFVQRYIEYALPGVVVVTLLCFLWSILEKHIIEEELPWNHPPKLEVKTVEAVWPTRQDTEEHGLRLIVTAKKPRNFTINGASLRVAEGEFWNRVERMAGSSIVSAFKLAAHPIKLIPALMSADELPFGEENIEFTINLGTGVNSSRRICHATIQSSLESLAGGPPRRNDRRVGRVVNNNDLIFRLRVEYRTSAAEKRGVLFAMGVSTRELLDGFELPKGTRFILHSK